MTANELRIGNLVNHDQESDIWIVDCIWTRVLHFFEDEETVISEIKVHDKPQKKFLLRNIIDKTEKFIPIVLTEDWLLRFGFEKTNNDSILDYPIWSKDGNEYFFQGDDHICHSFIQTENNEIKYVHRLQNLYFDLTGEELILT